MEGMMGVRGRAVFAALGGQKLTSRFLGEDRVRFFKKPFCIEHFYPDRLVVFGEVHDKVALFFCVLIGRLGEAND